MNDYLQVLRIMQYCLCLCSTLDVPNTSKSVLLDIKNKIDFEVDLITNSDVPF